MYLKKTVHLNGVVKIAVGAPKLTFTTLDRTTHPQAGCFFMLHGTNNQINKRNTPPREVLNYACLDPIKAMEFPSVKFPRKHAAWIFEQDFNFRRRKLKLHSSSNNVYTASALNSVSFTQNSEKRPPGGI